MPDLETGTEKEGKRTGKGPYAGWVQANRTLLLFGGVSVAVLIFLFYIFISHLALSPNVKIRRERERLTFTYFRLLDVNFYLEHGIRPRNNGQYPKPVILDAECGPWPVLPLRYMDVNGEMKFVSEGTPLRGKNAFFDFYWCEPCKRNMPFRYMSNGKWCLVASCGPDRKPEQKLFEAYLKDKYTLDSMDENGVAKYVKPYQYDPTNGLISGGDIICVSGRHDHNWDFSKIDP